ncbi:hypothetical protein [Paraburkholderia antibiotica]|uniref:hypothetical protein n=1 Tax=Paraburkholderia antibiotica TaxID=2728839 RepID=UPI0019817579|nr:hypothetical protein [Paraburkholderia antibiotica]
MAIDFKVGANRSFTLYSRHEYRGNASGNEVRSGQQLIASASARELTHDTRQLPRLVEFLRDARVGATAGGAAPEQLLRALQAAVERGDVIAVALKPFASPRSTAPVQQEIRPYYETVTPSQLVGRTQPVVRTARSPERPKLPRLPAEDGLAIWFARPGDVLPDGTIATPVSMPLGDAQPFDYQPDMPDGDVEELAGGDGRPGNNQAQNKQFKAVVKALGLSQDQARQLHDDIQDDEPMNYHGLLDSARSLFGGQDE